MQLIRDAWAGLDGKGRTVLILCVTILIVVLVLVGADVSGVLAWLGAG